LKKLATMIGGQTLVGSIGNTYPKSSGNCFGLIADKEYRIGNMNVENLQYLIKEKIIDFPIEIDTLDDKRALITDEILPKDFIDKGVCTICFPYKYWTDEQKKIYEGRVASGEIVELSDGIIAYKFKQRSEPLGYTIETQTNIVYGKLTEITGDIPDALLRYYKESK
jgi:hypothetical protein